MGFCCCPLPLVGLLEFVDPDLADLVAKLVAPWHLATLLLENVFLLDSDGGLMGTVKS
jgi:hypothetical protein